jgi:hypothetical protein
VLLLAFVYTLCYIVPMNKSLMFKKKNVTIMINNTCPFYILPEFTDKLIEAEELLDDQKGAFKVIKIYFVDSLFIIFLPFNKQVRLIHFFLSFFRNLLRK